MRRGRIKTSKKRHIWKQSNWTCFYCKSILQEGVNATVDHVKALRYGGNNDLDNLVACCRECNQRKSRSEQPLIRIK